MSITKVLVASLVSAAAACALAADARERGFISLGMAEGEVLFRIAKPDHKAVVANEKGQPEEKTWTYLPDSHHPQTITTIALRAGVVVNAERRIARQAGEARLLMPSKDQLRPAGRSTDT